MRILITGVTGTLGQELLKIAENDPDVREIVGISRDEQKQQQIQGKKLVKRLCDIRDRNGLFEHCKDIDTVFHTAALKCVDILEDNPIEAIKTNIEGTQNIVNASLDTGVPRLVMASTDKAVFPINIYGVTKAAAERVVLSAGYSVCRYGNVVGSRGSVVPVFVKAIKDKRKLPVTSYDMTRFWIPIESAATFIYSSGMMGEPGLQVPKMKAAKILDVAKSVLRIMGEDDETYPSEVIGIRPGEKIHECLSFGANGQDGVFSNSVDQYSADQLDLLLTPVVKRLS